MITVVCWLWEGWRNVYLPEHVAQLRRMIEKHSESDFRFVCVTDVPERMPGIETIALWDLPSPIVRGAGLPNCYKRLRLFSDEVKAELGDIVLSVDLDCIVSGDILSLVDPIADFKILKGVSNPFNGSIWQVRPGCKPELWDNLDQQMADKASSLAGHYGSDQAVMAMCLQGAPVWTESDGVYQFSSMGGFIAPSDAKVLFFAGGVKPWNIEYYRQIYWRAGL